mmetsp:Transcript_2569/g.7636  ORF Transcript_2569/g.7636 Transcript_2569/m.7636 type:complete len:258 (+) Transcript_2569:146-919(+)
MAPTRCRNFSKHSARSRAASPSPPSTASSNARMAPWVPFHRISAGRMPGESPSTSAFQKPAGFVVSRWKRWNERAGVELRTAWSVPSGMTSASPGFKSWRQHRTSASNGSSSSDGGVGAANNASKRLRFGSPSSVRASKHASGSTGRDAACGSSSSSSESHMAPTNSASSRCTKVTSFVPMSGAMTRSRPPGSTCSRECVPFPPMKTYCSAEWPPVRSSQCSSKSRSKPGNGGGFSAPRGSSVRLAVSDNGNCHWCK